MERGEQGARAGGHEEPHGDPLLLARGARTLLGVLRPRPGPPSSSHKSAGAARSAWKVISPAGTCSSPVILVAKS